MAGLQVWISGGGARYHASQGCRGLAEGQRKAALEGRGPRAVELVGITELTPERTPCSVCWPEQVGWDEWSDVEHQVLRAADSPYEIDFFDRVLRAVPGLRPSAVRVQHEFTYDNVKQGRIDFAIVANGVKIAIEVDGLHKSPTGQPVDARQHTDITARQNALTGQGWSVLRFPNGDVRLTPDRCRAEIEQCLRPCSSPAVPEYRPGVHAPRSTLGATFPTPAPPRVDRTDRDHRYATAPVATEMGNQPRSSKRALLLVAAGVAVVAAIAVPLALLASGDRSADTSAAPVGTRCPTDFPVKGNESQSGERIYHEPGWTYYAQTHPERCFADSAAAEDAGFRASGVR